MPDRPLYELVAAGLRASGKPLDEVVAALKSKGYAINKSTLSRWTTGTQPNLKHLKALRCLPEVLNMPLNEQASFYRGLNRWLGVKAGVRGSAPLPYRENVLGALPYFSGRTNELEYLRQIVGQRHSVAIVGLGGIGKTSLAQQLLRLSASQFASGCEALTLHPGQTSTEVIMQVARRLGLNLVADLSNTTKTDLLDWLASHAAGVDLLFLLDDVGTETQVSLLIQRLPDITWVLTSRRPLVMAQVEKFVLEAPSNVEAANLLLNQIGLSPNSNAFQLAHRIADRLGNLPLA